MKEMPNIIMITGLGLVTGQVWTMDKPVLATGMTMFMVGFILWKNLIK